MRILLIFFICLIYSQFTVAQHQPSKKAQSLYEKAQIYKKSREFDKVIAHLQKSVEADPLYVEAHYDLAFQLFMLQRVDESRKHFEKVVELRPGDKAYIQAYIMVADFVILEGQYQKAKEYAGQYLAAEPSARYKKEIDRAKQLIVQCDFAMEGMKKPVDFKPKELSPTINKFPQQYFPALTADQQILIFTGRTGNDEGIFESRLQNGQWSDPQPIASLNSSSNEGTSAISADGKVLIFTACEGAEGRYVYGACDLFISFNKGGEWSAPQNMGPRVNGRSWESQPSLSADGRRLFFISERGGGIGGKDIWMSRLGADGQWTTPVNLGPTVNTPFDEVSPFIHANGKSLFFSSRGHLGYGGLDLFRSDWDGKNWSAPTNLGYPVNDHYDQVSLTVTADGRKAYYSNEKLENGRIVSSLLTEFELPEEIKIKESSEYVKGKVYDAVTKKPIGATLVLTDLATNEPISTVNSDEELGDYLIVLTEGAEYALHITSPKYLFQSLTFDYKKGTERGDIVLDAYLEPIQYNKPVTLNNIFFETASYALLPKSKTELDELVKFLTNNPSAKIEIGGHTDDVGTDETNRVLSLNRAKSVVEFLQKVGIEASRLTSNGYGETQPVVPNDNDKNRALNRRIEFKILE